MPVWLQEVGHEIRLAAYSLWPTNSTLTSSDVETKNSVLKGIWSIPIIDCFTIIERYSTYKWAKNVSIVKGWGVLTPHTSRKMRKIMAAMRWGELMNTRSVAISSQSVQGGKYSGEVWSSVPLTSCSMLVWVRRRCCLALRSCSISIEAFLELPSTVGLRIFTNPPKYRRLQPSILRDPKKT